jgi:hypothetical protein
MEHAVFELLVRFMYTGALAPLQSGADGEGRYLSFPSCPEVLASLVLAADMYVVPGLVRECMDFVDPSNALVVMREAARVDTEETNVLVESCASVFVHNAAQMMSSVHRIRRDALKPTVRRVWEAVREWYGASLLEGGTPGGMLIEPL